MAGTTSSTPRTPRKRGEGQWALGYFEPLNPAERAKRDDDGLKVRARIESTYARKGFRSIDKTDLRTRFRWWGLYTQRRQGVSGGATATVEPHELEDEFFMLRIRIPGGRLTSDQLRAVARCSERFGRDVADVTDRQNVQLHWIRIVFNPEKMVWVNEQYIKQSDPGHVARLLIPFLEQAGLKKEVHAVSPDWLAKLVVLVRERTKTLVEMVTWVTPYFGQDVAMDEAAAKKFLTPALAPALAKLVARFEAEPAFHKEQWETIFKQVVEEQGMKMGQLAQPVRVALTGRTASPGLFEVMDVLGRDRTLIRLKKGIERAKTPA